MPTFQASECAYDVEDGWVDRTRYAYADGDVRVIAERFSPSAEAKSRVDEAIARFSLSMARYELLERRKIERPFVGEVVTHRFGGELDQFEIAAFFEAAGETWVFRVSGRNHTEDRCRLAFESFIETYQPVEPT
jgi:hypothetical protein